MRLDALGQLLAAGFQAQRDFAVDPDKHTHRVLFDLDGIARLVAAFGVDVIARVEDVGPCSAVQIARNGERLVGDVGVEHQQNVVVVDVLAAVVWLPDGRAVVVDHERPGVNGGPVRLFHGGRIGTEPFDLADLRAAALLGVAREEATPPENGMRFAELYELASELEQSDGLEVEVPIDPGEFVVLAVDVVVALLGSPEFVSVREHRHALGQQKRREEIADLAVAQHFDRLVVGRALCAAVPRAVVRFAVVAALQVRVVVLLVVRNEVAHSEAVVGDDEVDRRHGTPPARRIQVGRSRQAPGELGEHRWLAPPEIADGVAILAVPLRPQRGEAADVVAAVADVPGFGDELDLGDQRILLNDVEEAGELVHCVELARQRRGEVEAEPVDVHVRDPVPQRIHDELQGVGGAHVERVARSGGVEVVLRGVLDEPVVGGIVEAAESQGGPHVVALGRVIVDDVHDDFDVRLMEGLDHGLELVDLPSEPVGGGVAVVGGKEADGVVPPIV